jgi:carbonic anhydrase
MVRSVLSLSFFTAVHGWTYTNIADWGTQAAACSATNQSPIDIVTDTLQAASLSYTPQGMPAIPTAVIQNDIEANEHTWEVAIDVNNNATDKYGVVYEGKLYALRQFHYHSPSEHTVNGQHFDMEAHHVHTCYGAGCATPDEDDEILVMGVFLQVGDTANPYLDSFWTDFQGFTPGQEEIIQNLRMPYTEFFPDDKSFYQYIGSTTTPNCIPDVNWLVFQNSVTMSQAQLTAYRSAINVYPQVAGTAASTAPAGVSASWNTALGTNNRPVQALGTRVVHLAQDAAAPSSSSVWPWVVGIALGLGALLAAIGLCMYLNSSEKKPKASRAVKPVKQAPPPVEEQVPLVTPTQAVPQLVAPNLQMLAQPMVQTVPMAATAPLSYAAPTGSMAYAQYGPVIR